MGVMALKLGLTSKWGEESSRGEMLAQKHRGGTCLLGERLRGSDPGRRGGGCGIGRKQERRSKANPQLPVRSSGTGHPGHQRPVGMRTVTYLTGSF